MKATARFVAIVSPFGSRRSDAASPATPSTAGGASGSGAFSVPRRLSLPLVTAVAVLALVTTAFADSPPTVTINAASEVGVTSAKLTGEVNPEGGPSTTYWHFEYSETGDPDTWNFGPSGEIIGSEAEGTDPISVSANLEGLAPTHTYFIRLVAENGEGANHVETEAPYPSFATDAATAPVLATGTASAVSFTKAHLAGTVDPEGGNVNPVGGPITIFWQIQISETGDPGTWNFAGAGEITGAEAEGPDPIPVGADAEGLTPETSYFFRLIASYAGLEALSPEPHPSFETLFAPAPTVELDPVTAFTATTAELTSQVNPQGTPTSAYFEYSSDGGSTWTPFPNQIQYGTTNPPSPIPVDLGEAAAPVTFNLELTGLGPNTSYLVRLHASNVGGVSVTAPPQPFKTAQAVPEVQTLFASVATDSATLAANVNPHNAPVTYQFEWGDDDSYGNLVPASQTPLGASDNAFHFVTAPIGSITPGSTYHFRVLATNTETSEITTGRDRTFTTFVPAGPPAPCSNTSIREAQNATALPDCRAYEKVSPLDKNALNVVPRGRQAASPSGDRVGFVVQTSVPGAGNGIASPMLGTRGANGWQSRPIDSYGAGAFGAFTPDFARAAVTGTIGLSPEGTPKPGASITELTTGGQLFLRDNLTNTYTLVTPTPSPGAAIRVVGNTPDLGSIFYEIKDGIAQTETATTGEWNVYRWRNGETHLAGILPDGTVPEGGSRVGSVLQVGSAENAVSRDGARVIFHASGGGESHGGPLYARTEDGVHPPSTRYISASERIVPDPVGTLPALYWTAEAEHGSKVLFTSCEKLTDDSHANTTTVPPNESGVNGPACFSPSGLYSETPVLAGRDLYMYDFGANGGAGGLSDLTTADPSGGKVFGVVGASDSLDRIYFVAGGVLDPGSGAIPDQPNLYLWHDGVTKFIATFRKKFQQPDGAKPPVDQDNWTLDPTDREQESRVSPDGNHLLITSRAPLTGYDNANPLACPPADISNPSFDFNPEGRCAEVYLYDASADQLRCVSCNPDGSPPAGDATLTGVVPGVASPTTLPPPKNLSPDGRTVFFATPDALASRDTNARLDVYQWRDGAVTLVSDGKTTAGAIFVDATPSGNDVFFLTDQRLLGSDTDGLVDIYDARVGGGFPEPVPTPPCVGEACRGPASSVPGDAAPATLRFTGPGDPNALHCRQGKVPRRGKCLKKKHAKKHPKHHRANSNGRAGR